MTQTDQVTRGDSSQVLLRACDDALQAGRIAQALTCCEEVLGVEPDHEEAALKKARCLVALGHHQAARQVFEQLLRARPGSYSAWLEAAHLCRRQGASKQARLAYGQAVDLAPDRYEAFLGLTRLFRELGDEAAAQQTEQQTLRVIGGTPTSVQMTVYSLLARYRLEEGKPLAALPHLQQAIARAMQVPDGAAALHELLIDLGEACLRLGRIVDAQQVLSQASAATAESTLARLAQLSYRHNMWEEAIEVCRRSAQLHPQSATAHWSLAWLLSECWQMDEALSSLAQAQTLGDLPQLKTLEASIASRQGDVQRAFELYMELVQTPGGEPESASRAAMTALYHPTLSAAEVTDLHRRLFAPLGVAARPADSFERTPLDGRRLKLGIVGGDFFHQHPVNIFMQPILREFDSQRIEVFVYFTGDSYDEQTRIARDRVEHWLEASALNDVQLAQRIDVDEIDLLLDLGGHTGHQRMALFGQRAAPVQATYLGYPGTTGVPNIDWLVGDEEVTPEHLNHLYTEKVMRLDGTVFCFAPETHYPYPAYGGKHARRRLTFGSFNNSMKLNDFTVQLWARVLLAVPDARLILRAPALLDPGAIEHLRHRFEAAGIEAQRLEFRGPVGLTDMMADYEDVDIALDPWPYGGGTTSLQGMWMGVPLLTLRGEHFASRMGGSFMIAAGLGEWVADSEAAFVEIAAGWAQRRKALLKLKRDMRARLLNSPAWSIEKHTRSLEDAFFRMVNPDEANVRTKSIH